MDSRSIDLLLSCGCIVTESIETIVHIPRKDEKRTCRKHGEVTISKVGIPYKPQEDQKAELIKIGS